MKTNQTKSIGTSMFRVRGWMLNVALALVLFSAANALADVHYVDVSSANAAPPYTSWSTASTSIQDAVDAATAGDEIVVTNGIYASGGQDGNRVAVHKVLSVRSANGPQSTTIDGGGAGRCVSLINGASLSGFTLTRGVALIGGGAIGGTLNNCTLTRNFALGTEASAFGGGAAYCTLDNCILTDNIAGVSHGMGYPVPVSAYGGGAYRCTLNNCTLTGNSAGAALGEYNEYGGGASDCTLRNCTVTGNSAYYGGGVYHCTLNNCIVYFNRLQNSRYPVDGSSFNYCCTTPQPNGFGNVTNEPLFMDTNGWANLRLQSNSPCINAGNNSYVTSATDLDGNPRIAGGTVDIGAFEFQSLASKISYAWLQQFNLPIDPLTDSADPDGDRMNNWQEWRCWTDPTNALSALRLLTPATVGSDLLVRWESVAGRAYFLERSTAPSSAFTPLATGIPGQPGTTTYTDTNAIGAGPRFYRVGVGD